MVQRPSEHKMKIDAIIAKARRAIRRHGRNRVSFRAYGKYYYVHVHLREPKASVYFYKERGMKNWKFDHMTR
jgi:hypothetical protein